MAVPQAVEPGHYTLRARTNGTIDFEASWTIDDDPVDLTGWTGKAQIRSSAKAARVLLELDVDVVDPVGGVVRISCASGATANLPIGPDAEWDLLLSGGGQDVPLLAGPVIVSGGVSR